MSSPVVTATASRSLSIAIPASFIEVCENLEQRTILIGRIARAAAIFHVDEILVYADLSDPFHVRDLRLVIRVLEYMEAPQYLRKYLFTKQPELRYVGLLPPLRTPHHPIEKRARALRDGDIREGYALQRKGKASVDVGVERLLPLRSPLPKKVLGRVSVRIGRTTEDTLTAALAPPGAAGEYWGYRVTEERHALGEFIPRTFADSLVVATSRKGIAVKEIWTVLQTRWREAKRVLVLFGSHSEGLTEISHRQGYELATFAHFVVNTVPGQGVATVRTDEAVIASLAVLNLLDVL